MAVKMIISTPEGPAGRIAKWKRTAAVDLESGAVYLPSPFVDMDEGDVYLAALWEGEPVCVTYRNHCYFRVDWLARQSTDPADVANILRAETYIRENYRKDLAEEARP